MSSPRATVTLACVPVWPPVQLQVLAAVAGGAGRLGQVVAARVERDGAEDIGVAGGAHAAEAGRGGHRVAGGRQRPGGLGAVPPLSLTRSCSGSGFGASSLLVIEQVMSSPRATVTLACVPVWPPVQLQVLACSRRAGRLGQVVAAGVDVTGLTDIGVAGGAHAAEAGRGGHRVAGGRQRPGGLGGGAAVVVDDDLVQGQLRRVVVVGDRAGDVIAEGDRHLACVPVWPPVQLQVPAL